MSRLLRLVMRHHRCGGQYIASLALIIAVPCLAIAQQPTTPPAASAASGAPQFQQSAEWSKLPRMQLERQFAGPLQDTVVQRWRDPLDGTVCYIYLPIFVAHTPAGPA